MGSCDRIMQVDSASETLRRLEVTIIWMWSTEPVCEPTDRRGVLERLGAVSTAVERLAFRDEFEPGRPCREAELVRCVAELDDLSRWWSDLDVVNSS